MFVTHSVFESVYLSQRIVVMAARPGRVMADLRSEAPYPRDALFRTSAEYAHLCRVASENLQAGDCRMSDLPLSPSARRTTAPTPKRGRSSPRSGASSACAASSWPGIIAPVVIGILALDRVGIDGPPQGHPALHPARARS